MSRINTPVNQKRLTNVAIVRLKKGGKRFEIACYPNKVQEWKLKIEKDIDEVLQNQVVFLSVSKGVLAKEKELKQCFGTMDQAKICHMILNQGELQVSEKERKDQNENLIKDIVSIIAEKCYNPATKKLLSTGVIEDALSQIHFSIVANKNAKQNALVAIKALIEKAPIPIERAPMRLSVQLSNEEKKDALEEMVQVVEDVSKESDKVIVKCLIEPSKFRDINDFVKKEGGSVDILAQNAIVDDQIN